ncbi:MAG TPA: TetR/AcrR family transcriptional regulator [Methanocella sp.]|nr:TetR/AcrR family transcriptional regulator [Methanocella sp.]
MDRIRHDSTIPDKLLDAAERMIYEAGVDQVTMDGVARIAGVDRSTLHRHFPGKESLCSAVVARILQRINTAIKGRIAGMRGYERLRESCLTMAGFLHANPKQLEVLHNSRRLKGADPNDEHTAVLMQTIRENQRFSTDILIDTISDGKFVAGINPAATGLFLRMAIHDVYGIPPLPLHLLDKSDVKHEDYIRNSRDPIYRSILLSPDN